MYGTPHASGGPQKPCKWFGVERGRLGRGPLLPSRATPDGEPDGLIFGPSGSPCAGITALSAITVVRANLKARNLSLLEWTVFDVYVTTGHWRRFGTLSPCCHFRGGAVARQGG